MEQNIGHLSGRKLDDVWERELLIFYWMTRYFPSFRLFLLLSPNDEQIQVVTLSINLAVVSSWTPNVLAKMLDDMVFVRTLMNTPKLALIFSYYLDDDLNIFIWHHFTICNEIRATDCRVNNGNMIFTVSVPNCLFWWIPSSPAWPFLKSTIN